MYNSLVLAALLPLTGPTVGEPFAPLPTPVRAEFPVTDSAVDPADRIPALPQRTRVAYASDNETPDRAWSPSAPAPQPVAVPSIPVSPPPRETNSAPFPAAAPSTFAQSANRPNEIRLHGKLDIPKWNKVILAANFQAQLTSLRTVQQGAEGQPVLVPLREGMRVVEGQVLGNLDTRLLESQRLIALCKLKVAQAEAENEILVKVALAGVNTKKGALAILEEANSMHEGAITKLEIFQAKLEVDQAVANYQLQDYNLHIIKKEELNAQSQEVTAAEEMIQLRQFVSPISGMIVKIEKAEGEWLREGDPVLEIVQLDTLRLILRVDGNRHDANSVSGKAVSVTARSVDGKAEEFLGKVVFASPIFNSDDTFDVYIDVQNRSVGNSWLLQPGRMVDAAIKL